MRVAQYATTDVDQYIEEAGRARHPLDVDRWRAAGLRDRGCAPAELATRPTHKTRATSPRVSSHKRDRSRSRTETLPAITTPMLQLAEVPSRLSLRSTRRRGLTALTGRSVEPRRGSYVMAPDSADLTNTFTDRKEASHAVRSNHPSIAVTIGEQQRVYHAFITTAPPALDGPSTITLHASTFADVSGFAADPLVHHRASSKAPPRLILIESRELTWP